MSDLLLGGMTPMRPGHLLSRPSTREVVRFNRRGLGTTTDERFAADTARVNEIVDNITSTGNLNSVNWMPVLDKAGAIARAADSDDDMALIYATEDAIATAAAYVPVVGSVVSILFSLISKLTRWIASAVPGLQWCGPSLPNYVAMNAMNIVHGLPGTTGDLAQQRIYRDDGMLFIGTLLTRRSGIYSWDISPADFISWEDPPMWKHVTSDISGEVPFTMHLERTTSEERKKRLGIACRPRRRFTPPAPPAASGYRQWEDWLRDHPDQAGTDAAKAVGDMVVDLLFEHGDIQELAFGWNSTSLGDRCSTWGYLFSVKALPNETLMALIFWMATLPTTDSPEGAALNTLVSQLPVPGVAGSGMWWSDGLLWSCQDFIRKNTDGYVYHLHALLDEYNRRVASGAIVRPVAAQLVARGRELVPAGLPAGKKAPAPTGWSTGEKVAVGGVAVGAGALVTKLLGWW